MLFRGECEVFSNFYILKEPMVWKGKKWATSEHVFQSEKTLLEPEKELIRLAPTPGISKRLGKTVTLRKDWEDVKDDIMYRVVRKKFKDHELARILMSCEEEIVEENFWHDTYWGKCNCTKHCGQGKNRLGKILMLVREELKEEK